MENLSTQPIQTTQTLPQNSPIQPILIPEKPKTNFTMIGLVVLACLIVFGFGGYYIGHQSSVVNQNTGKDLPESATSTPEVANDLTINWKTYTSTKYGFLLKYPNEYVISNEDPSGQSVYFVPNNYESLPEQDKYNAPTINVNILPSSTTNGQNTPNTFVDSAKAPGFDNKRDIVAKTIAGQSAMQFMSNNTQAGSGRDEINTVIQIPESNTLVLITVATEGNGDPYNLPSQILSTFKFFKDSQTSNSTSNWNTYKDPQNKFFFKYPKDQGVKISQNTVGIYGMDFIEFEVSELETSEKDPARWWAVQNDLHGYSKECYTQGTVNIQGAQKVISLQNTSKNEVCLGPSFGIDIVVVYKEVLYKLNYNDSAKSREILSTFKFTN